MKSLYEEFEKLSKTDFDYYNANRLTNNVFKNPFSTGGDHLEFIKTYFRKAGKNNVLLEEFSLDKIAEEEINNLNAIHTNSVFFLGLLIRSKTEFKNNLFFNEVNKPVYPTFPLIWFLSILFHDMAYKFEKDPNLKLEIFDIDCAIKKFNIEHFLLDVDLKTISEVNVKLIDSIKPYFIYRRYSMKVIDHGILAGIYLYDQLVKNRIIKKAQNELNSKKWHDTLDIQYAIACFSIACHNIWLPTPDKICEYANFELIDLIKFKPISLSNFPLLFLFGIVDTMDPIKTYINDHEPEYVLKNILIDFESTSVTFINKEDSFLKFEELVKKSDNLIGWLDVKIESKKNELKIIFKS